MQNSLSDAKSIFLVAIERYKPQEWPIFLDGACGQDQELRSHVEELLNAHQRDDSFLDQPTSALPAEPEEPVGARIGPFKLLQKIGEGGFGIVYMAEQTKPIRRKVALKIIKPGMDSNDVVARFDAERQALAMMDHPNIAKVLDAGTTDSGRPYFAMELVKGVSITEYADQNHLTTAQRLELFVSICRAVQHAHQKGVIHRDLKPSNVMVTLHDGKPVPKVIDFGVSKAISQPLTEQTLFTRYGQAIGTPQYMSPEQAEMSGLDVDTRSDVYSLGVLLYELLTGRTPFLLEQIRKAGFDEMRRMIREQDPIRPSNILQTFDADTATTVASNRSSKPESLKKLFRGELDWIVMRSLEKDRNRRYETASGLAEDVQRHLDNEPVLASPPSLTYNLRKIYRRNRGVCLTAGAIAAALLLATGISFYAMRDSQESARHAILAKLQAETEQKIAEQAKLDASQQREKAEAARSVAAAEAKAAKQTLQLMLSLMSKADRNPKTGAPFTVREALMELSNLSLASQPFSTETEPSENQSAPRPMEMLGWDTAVELNMGLAEAFRSAGNFTLTTKHSEKAIAHLDAAGEPDALKRAICLRYIGFYGGQEDKLRGAVKIGRDLQNPREQVASLTLLARHLMRQEQQTEAITLLREASDLYDPHADLELDEVPQFFLARLHRQHLGDPAQAKKWEEIAVKRVLQSVGGTDREWLKKGLSLKKESQLDQAELAFLVSQSLYAEAGKANLGTWELGWLLAQVGNYFHIAELERAAECFEKSFEAFTGKSEYIAARSRLKMSELYVQLGNDQKALPHLRQLLTSRGQFAPEAARLLRLIAIEDQEVQEWLEIERGKLELEVAQASGPEAVGDISGTLAVFEFFDGNRERVFELLRMGGISHFGDPTFAKLAFRRGYPDAAQTYAKRILNQFQIRDKNYEWKLVNVARIHYHNNDRDTGISLVRKALDLSRKRSEQDDHLHYWLCFELAMLLKESSPQEASDLFAETTDGLGGAASESRIILSTSDVFERAVQLFCHIRSGRDYDARQFETELKRRITCAEAEYSRFLLLSALSNLYTQEQDFTAALDPMEKAVLQLDDKQDAFPTLPAVKDLVDLYRRTNQLERGCDFLEDVVAKWDKDFPSRHPWRAFVRIHLADLLQEVDRNDSRLLSLLQEAQNILRLHEIIPEETHAKVAEMLAQSGSPEEAVRVAGSSIE